MKTSFIRLLVVAIFAAVGFATVVAHAQDLGAVKQRMNQRLAKIDQLKAQGVLGENNRGLIELRGGDVDAGDVMASENRDRQIVYVEIAKQTGTSVEQVAHKRAQQIAAGSAAGVWVQKDDGSWSKK